MKAVLDSSVIVSAFLKPSGTPATLLERAQQGAFVLCVSDDILEETTRALHRPRIREGYSYTNDEVEHFIALLIQTAEVVHDLPNVPALGPRRCGRRATCANDHAADGPIRLDEKRGGKSVMATVGSIVVVSPHLDDAVLSIGGLIAREVAHGHAVEVWTCFTAGPSLDAIPPEARVFGDYTTRRAEDERALAVVGAGHRYLDLPERIWREPPLARTLHVFRTPPREADFAQLSAVRAAIGEALDAGARVYAPLGVGHHVDHVEVALAALREMLARGAFERVRFYEDSYALGGACRRAHFVTRSRPWRWLGAPGWASPRVAALLRLVAMAASGPGLDTYLPEAATLTWTCKPAPIDDETERVKLAAVAEYGSQVKAFGGAGAVRRFMRRGHRLLGGEGIWRSSAH